MSGLKKTIIFIAALFVLFCAYWAVGRNVMIKAVGTQINEMQPEGYKVAHKGLSTGGFPMKFRARLDKLNVASPRNIDKPWSIKADNIRLEALSLNPLKWNAVHRGDARIDMRGPKGERWLFDARPFNVDMTARAGLNGELKTIEISTAKLKTQAVIGTLPPIVAIDKASLRAAPEGGDMKYEIALENIYLEKDTLKNFQKIFGPRIESLSGEASAMGLTSFESEVIKEWKKSGPIIGENWKISWGKTVFVGRFNLTQSATGLSGTISIELEDINKLISRLQEADVFSRKQARNAKLAAILLPVNQNGRQEITLILRDGFITLFGQKLFEL